MTKKMWSLIKRTAGGALSPKWFLKELDVSPEEEILQFNIPGEKAVILVKHDPLSGISDRIRNLLKTDKEMAADVEKIREEAVLEYKARLEMGSVAPEDMPNMEVLAIGNED